MGIQRSSVIHVTPPSGFTVTANVGAASTSATSWPSVCSKHPANAMASVMILADTPAAAAAGGYVDDGKQ